MAMGFTQKSLTSIESVAWAGMLACAMACLAGCGGSSVHTVAAGGILKIDGEPVTDAVATVKFYPTSGGRSATARVNEDGTFQLSYLKPGDGLPPGNYKVAVTASISKVKPGITADEEYAGVGVKTKFLMPNEFTNVRTTPLTYEVVDTGDEQFIEIDVVLDK